ncbi:substrate-binding domain-containing protein [Paracoccus pantotrophus]|uniref:substrate-binding domain-containing protein n=1 Tax=Paracoccus pantotrophus TaxID=82367 RepID=UPI0008EA8EC3|nr:substrate-binding domain-containing protein [Paracoccus pantotrophus]MDF3855828.1 substrate-binding domain-containing protein [Paracoccus pantotrophus]RNI16257.1 LacI family DNA-binding transcriptional regulator [Paracoccus pantotrophus]SFO82612.1 transcriptional regulator, LacI family [Paracoccus pantotrophus]
MANDRPNHGQGIGLKAVADELGLSQSTVSRALRNHPSIPAATRERVAQAAKRMGYAPNARARGLAIGRTEAIGLVFPLERLRLVQTNFVDVLSGISDVVTERGYNLLLSPFRDDESSVLRRLATSRMVDGLIITRPLVHDPRIALLAGTGIPFVVHGRSDVDIPYSYVDVDNFEIFRRLAEVLLDYGHRRIAALNSYRRFRYAAARDAGYRAAMEGRHVPVDPDLVLETAMTEEDGLKFGARLLSLPEPPTAIICGSIFLAKGVYRAAAEAGLTIGKDLSVVAHDDQLRGISAADFTPALTATQKSVEMAGRRLAEILIDRIEGRNDTPIGEVGQADLILRGSVGRYML